LFLDRVTIKRALVWCDFVELTCLLAEIPEVKFRIVRRKQALHALGSSKSIDRETGLVAIKFSSVRGYKS
jgi:hypothetical protein